MAALIQAKPAQAAGTPAQSGDGPTSTIPATDRGRILQLWIDGGPATKAAAEAALTGTDDDAPSWPARRTSLSFTMNGSQPHSC
ncbi:hypothetical protein [Streptomyces huiliensis]|uniref:hypothetical protein n=1 Tax=Streptomyces huiliensis TaxID=2876027 RepID=UPI0021DF9DB3|nr:hypothetical protein [Streptomyces huiliensis]